MYVPVLERGEETLDFAWFEIPAHRVLHFELLLLLVELASDDFLVDRIDNEVFQFADARYLENGK